MGIINKSTAEINDLLDKVENMPEGGVAGKTPVLETGSTTTLDPGQNATSEVVANGTDEKGNPKYKINFGIPRGADGSGGSGGGTADSVEWKNVLNKPTWVNSSTKPTYTATEVGALPVTTTIPSKTSQLTNDSNYVTSSTLKTINGQSIVGAGNIEISGTGSGIADAPSDGKTYGRKDGGWSVITSAGGSVDITEILLKLAQLAEIQGTCTDEDYNALKGYADSGIITYINVEGTSMIVHVKNLDGVIQALYEFNDNQIVSRLVYIIDTSKKVSIINNSLFDVGNYGSGILGKYSKPTFYSAVSATDTISEAIGKLEAGIGNSVGDSSGIYYLSSSILDLNKESTADEILSAFGGYEKIEEFLTEVAVNGKLGVIRKKTKEIISDKSFNIPISFVFTGFLLSYFTIEFVKTSSTDPLDQKKISISIQYDSTNHSIKKFNIVETYPTGFRMNSSFYNIVSESTNEEISSAIGGESGMRKLIHAIEDGNSIYINGTSPTKQRTELFPDIYMIDENGDMNVILFGFGMNLWGVVGGYLVISYEKSSNTFSAFVNSIS